MKKKYDSSWDMDENEDEEAFDKIYAKWEKRSWESWLRENLQFPFLAERVEDLEEMPFTRKTKTEPFGLGHVMEVIDIETEDDHYGIILKVKDGKRTGHVALCEVEVTSKDNENFWPVREYVVWFANC